MNPLQQRIQQIRSQIQLLQAEGEVAPDRVWISRFSARNRPGGKVYHYYKLMQEQDKRVKQRCYLGKPSNPKYKRWLAAIERRNQIQELEAIAKRLQRQLVNEDSSPLEGSSHNQAKATPLTNLTAKLQRLLVQRLPGKISMVSSEVELLLELIKQHSHNFSITTIY